MNRLARTLVYLAAAALIASWLAVACGGEWEWSQPAPHHQAACRVQSGQNAGSGVYVAYDDLRGVLTAAHIIESNTSATVWFSDGESVSGTATTDKYGYDVAFVSVTHAGITPLSVASSPPAPDSRVEFVTYGGPEHRLRTFWATARGGGRYSATVISGDSGGAILNEQHQVVGIQSYGKSGSINSSWGVYRGAGSATCGQIHAFVQRVREKIIGGWHGSQPDCPDGKCQKLGGGLRWERGGSIEFYPPRWQESPPILPGPGPEPPDAPLVPIEQPQSPGVDREAMEVINARLDALAAAIAAIPAGPQGPSGPVGPAGLPGKDAMIDLDALADKVAAKLPASSNNPLALQRALNAAEIATKRADQAKLAADEADRKLGDLEIRIQRAENLNVDDMVRSGQLHFRLYFDRHGQVIRAETITEGE